jgi:hypothetical protein
MDHAFFIGQMDVAMDDNKKMVEETISVTGEEYRPWDDMHASSFWKNMATVKLAFLCSIKLQVGNDVKIKF